MKISIITVVYNNEHTIQDTIKSVMAQDYNQIEYIVIDGNSTDNTLNIIQSSKDKISKIISEPDANLWDAMNKGIFNATGDILSFLNAGDIYIDNKVVSTIANKFNTYPFDLLYANLYYVSSCNTNKIVRKWYSGKFHKNKFKIGWHPPHLTCFIKKEVFKKYGNFRLDLNIAADYELLLRFLYKNDISVYYLNKYIIKMRMGGISNKSCYSIIKANKECYRAWKINKFNPPPFFIFLKIFRKIFQYFKF